MTGHVLVVANQKGGVGKTTTAENLAVTAAQDGSAVLAVDLDPQFALTRHLLGVRPLALAVSDVLAPAAEGAVAIDEVILAAEQPGLDVLPAHRSLRRRELGLAGEHRREELLTRALEPVRHRYDLVLVDTPPNLGLLTVNALVAADRVLAPVSAEDEGAAQGLLELRATLEHLSRPGESPPVLTPLLTRWDARRLAARALADGLAEVDLEFASERIPATAAAHQAPLHGGAAAATSPDGRLACAYRRLRHELLEGTAR